MTVEELVVTVGSGKARIVNKFLINEIIDDGLSIFGRHTPRCKLLLNLRSAMFTQTAKARSLSKSHFFRNLSYSFLAHTNLSLPYWSPQILVSL